MKTKCLFVAFAGLLAACGSSTPNESPPDASTVDAPAPTKICDPEGQTGCTMAPDTKCSVTGSTEVAPTCVAGGGTVADQGTCNRTSFGVDNCVDGEFCTRYGQATTSFVCEKFCAQDSDCYSATDAGPTSDWCVGLDNLQASPVDPPDGFCFHGCDLFSGATECSGPWAGDTCELAIFQDVTDTEQGTIPHGACRMSTAGVAPGTTCMADTDCAAGQGCYLTPTPAGVPDGGAATYSCQTMCDNDNACATAGLNCVTIFTDGAVNGIGICQ